MVWAACSLRRAAVLLAGLALLLAAPGVSAIAQELSTPTATATPSAPLTAEPSTAAAAAAPPVDQTPTATPLEGEGTVAPIASATPPAPTGTALPSAPSATPTAPGTLLPSATPTATAGTPTPGALVGRDLLLTVDDVPPGYQDVYQRLEEMNIDTRVLVRTDGAPGAWLIGSVIVLNDGPIPPLTARDAAQFQEEFVRGLILGMRGLEVSDWDLQPPTGLGEQELVYRFRYEWDNDNVPSEGLGAMTMLVRGRVQAILMAMSGDTEVIDEVRQYARVVDARVVAALREAR